MCLLYKNSPWKLILISIIKNSYQLIKLIFTAIFLRAHSWNFITKQMTLYFKKWQYTHNSYKCQNSFLISTGNKHRFPCKFHRQYFIAFFLCGTRVHVRWITSLPAAELVSECWVDLICTARVLLTGDD